MKKILFSILALASFVLAEANDGVYFTSGNQLVPLAETKIQVKKEILTISLQDDGHAKVDVYYEFLNLESSPKTVLMGFEADPSYNDDYKFYPNGKHPHIFDFTVEMNGVKLPYKNAVCNLDGTRLYSPIDSKRWKLDEEGGTTLVSKTDPSKSINNFAYVYSFNATFNPGINKVHHTYSYSLSYTISNAFQLEYKLSPAARWANKQIDDFTLYICAENTAKHFLVSKNAFGQSQFVVDKGFGKIRNSELYDDAQYEVSLRNGTIKMHKTNFKPQGELSITSADAMHTFSGNAKFGYFYDRGSALALYSWEAVEERKSNISNALKARVTKNLPYAHRGHVFKDATLKKYFESLWWYMPDPNYKDDTTGFTKVDWEYVKGGK